MSILFDPLDYWLPPPNKLYHFTDQPLSTRMRIEGWESAHLKYAPTEAEIEAIKARAQATEQRRLALAERLEQFAGRADR